MKSKLRHRSARTWHEALSAWVAPRGLEDAIRWRPTVRAYEERLRSSGVRTGGGPEAFRGAEVSTSIVFPLLNSEATLEEALESALAQDGNPEIIVVDGGSTDGTLGIIERYSGRVHRWLSEPDDGMYDAINKCIALASGRLVHILNGDDLLTEGSVRLAMAHYRSRTDDHCLRGALGRVTADGEMREVWRRSGRTGLNPEPIPILHPSWYVPRAVYENAGLYLPYFRISADQEYAFHLWKTGTSFVDLPEVLALFREGGMSTSSVGQHESMETNAFYFGRPRAAALYGQKMFRKGRYAAASRLLGPERTEALWTRIKELRNAG